MAKRGRKPIDYEQLDLWDGEWYVALYRLSEGGELPVRTTQWWTRRQLGPSLAERLAMLRRMSLEEYWAYLLAHTPGLDREPPPLAKNRAHAERQRAAEIASLARWVDPTAIQQRQQGREIWEALWTARTRAEGEDGCRRWMAVDPESAFPTHLLGLLPQFFAVTSDRRFPTSPSTNEARITTVAAGMAGACIGISPLTAVHRVRTLTHTPGGPLWNANAQRCDCWRCDRAREIRVFDAVVDSARKEESQ